MVNVPLQEIVLAGPRGFCAGVDRAIDIVELALQVCPPPVYVRREIVHNRHVVEGLRVIDATCPLVTKVHLEAIRYAREGYSIILVGHADHDEVVGTMGEAPDRMFLIAHPEDVDKLAVADPDKVAYLTQTTLSVDDTRDCIEALRRRFPKIVGPAKNDICYATQNRQAAVKTVAGAVDVLLVIGAANSSNANRLVEVSTVMGTPSYLINDKNDIRPEWLDGSKRVGVTAGASTPEFLVTEVVEALQHAGRVAVREVHVVDEDVRFGLPRELEDIARQGGKTLPQRRGAAVSEERHASRHLPSRTRRAQTGSCLARDGARPGRSGEGAGRAAGDGQARARRLPEEPARADPGRRDHGRPCARSLGIRQGPRGAAGYRGAGEAQAGLPAQAGAAARADSAPRAQRVLPRPQLRRPCRRAWRRGARAPGVLHQARHCRRGTRR